MRMASRRRRVPKASALAVAPTNGSFLAFVASMVLLWGEDATSTELRLSYRDYGNEARPDVGFRIARNAD